MKTARRTLILAGLFGLGCSGMSGVGEGDGSLMGMPTGATTGATTGAATGATTGTTTGATTGTTTGATTGTVTGTTTPMEPVVDDNGFATLACTPGIPATTQFPNLLNRQYEASVRDLLNVSSVGGTPISEALIADADDNGPMTPDAWRIYQQVAGQIAADVMAGPNRSLFIDCDPAAAGCMDTTIATFGRKAYRRPLTPEETARFQALGQTTPPGTPEEVATTTLEAFLLSPNFLMKPEIGATPSGAGFALTSHEVATRLAFTLWGTVPDAELNTAADMDQLQTAEQIAAQAGRMIDIREKTGPLLAAFHSEWLQMNNDAQHWFERDHDTNLYPSYAPAKKASWKAELDAFFEEIAFSGGGFSDLLLSNVAFINQDNADIYGFDPASYGPDLVRTELDATTRPGFLTRAGFLGSYSDYDSPSPILRGAFITVWMLGVNPGSPIPGAAMATVEGTFPTKRAYVEELTKPQECVGCHSVLNPAGFVLEGYDALGRPQTTDAKYGGAIDASVTTATVQFGGTKTLEISSPLQLMQEIAATPTSTQLYAKALVSYAFGRRPNPQDNCIVNDLDASLKQSSTILDTFAALTQAESFRVRVREN